MNFAKMLQNNLLKESRNWRIFKRKKLVLNGYTSSFLAMAVLASAPFVANAAPTGGDITSGQGSISQSGLNTNINQQSNRLDINWNDFSSNVNESINFAQPSQNAIAINRVIGGVPSQLRGALNANGSVYIMNEAGITFFDTSRVNVNNLLATTAANLNIDGDKFNFSGATGSVINHGDITVSNGGWAVLAAPYVENTGTIVANLGQIELGSATEFTIDLRGDNLITYSITDDLLNKIGVTNSGVLSARSGAIGISANIASDIVTSVVNLDGVIDASAFDLSANGGSILITSTGDINNIANIDASANENGDGGEVITIADKIMNFLSDAFISATGGSESGDGGFIEVSGKDLLIRGGLDASAANGQAGSVLFDPTDYTILDGVGVGGFNESYESEVEARSQSGTNYIYSAENILTVEDITDGEITGGWGSITLEATGDESGIGKVVFEDKTNTILTNSNITISAADGGVDIGNLHAKYGDIIISTTSGGGVNAGDLTTEGNRDDITVTAGSGGINVGNLSTGSTDTEEAGDITLTATNGGSVTTKNLSVKSIYSESDSLDSAVDIDIDADSDVLIDGNITMTMQLDDDEYGEDIETDVGLSIDAGIAGTGGIEITGDVNLSATSISDGYEAEADATVQLYSANDIKTKSITVSTLATTDNDDQDVDSDLDINAGYYGSGGNSASVLIDGNITISADAEQFVKYIGYDDDVESNVEITAVDDVTVTGDIDASGTSLNDGASVGVEIEATGGAVDLQSNVTVSAAGSMDYKHSTQNFADLSVNSQENLHIGGNVDVVSTIDNSSVSYTNGDGAGYYTKDAIADADIYLKSNSGNVNVDGDISSAASVVLKAPAHEHQYNGVDDDNNPNHNDSFEGEHYPLEVRGLVHADSDVTILAGIDANLGGVSSSASIDVENVDIDENDFLVDFVGDDETYYNSGAASDLFISAGSNEGGGDVTTGTLLSNADVKYNNGVVATFDSSSDLDVSAANDLTITGDVTNNASTDVKYNDYDNNAYENNADVETEIAAGAVKYRVEGGYYDNTGLGTVTINGNIDQNATAKTLYSLDNSGNEGSLSTQSNLNSSILASDDIVIAGNIDIHAEASSDGDSEGINDSVNSYVDSIIEAASDIFNGGSAADHIGEGEEVAINDITINGNTSITSNASGEVANRSEIYHYVDADNDVTINGDLDAHASINSSYGEYSHAQSDVGIFAGGRKWHNVYHNDGGDEGYWNWESFVTDGSVSITGDTNITSDAQGEYGVSANSNYNVEATHDVDIIGNTDVHSNAESGGYANAFTQTVIIAGDFNGDSLPGGSVSDTVNGGSGNDSVDGGSGNDVITPEFTGSISITGDSNITANAEVIEDILGDEPPAQAVRFRNTASANSNHSMLATDNVLIDGDLVNRATATHIINEPEEEFATDSFDDVQAQARTTAVALTGWLDSNPATTDPTVQANEELLVQNFSGESGDNDIKGADYALLILDGDERPAPPVPPRPPVAPPEDPTPPAPEGPVDEPTPPTPPTLGSSLDELIHYIISLAQGDKYKEPTSRGLGNIAPAAGGINGQFCETVNTENTRICNPTNTGM